MNSATRQRDPVEDRLDRIDAAVTEVRVTVGRIDERDQARTKSDEARAAADADREQRLRGLERFRYALPATALASVASLVATLMHH